MNTTIIDRQTIIQSVKDLRKVHSSMSDQEFARMYEKKYGVLQNVVLSVLDTIV